MESAKMTSSFSVLSPIPVKTTITSFSTYLEINANIFHDKMRASNRDKIIAEVILRSVVQETFEEFREHGDVDLACCHERVRAAGDGHDWVEEEEDEEVGDDGGGRDFANLAVPDAVQDQEADGAHQPGK